MEGWKFFISKIRRKGRGWGDRGFFGEGKWKKWN